MAFSKANTVIKILLVIPASLYSGIIFYSLQSDTSVYWLLFGVVFGVIVVHAFIECIYQFDVRAIFSHKKHLIFAMACSLFIMISFSADLFGYDRYIPKASALEDIIVQPTTSYYGYWGNDQTGLTGDAARPPDRTSQYIDFPIVSFGLAIAIGLYGADCGVVVRLAFP